MSYWVTTRSRRVAVVRASVQLTFSATPDVRVLAATFGFAAVSTIAFGLGPALKLSRRDLVTDLKDRGGAARRRAAASAPAISW